MLADFENIFKSFFSSDLQGTAVGVRGLRNLGNTCFLNSVLQAVSSCPSFVDHVHNLSALGGGDGAFTNHLYNCLTEIRNNDTRSPYNPHHVRRLLAKFNPDFQGNDEQDALEVFESLLACLKAETEKQVAKKVYNSRRNCVQSSLISRPLRIDAGTIGKLSCPFEGWSCSHLECQACIAQEGASAARWMPTRHQVFTTLPLPVALSAPSLVGQQFGQLGVTKVASTAGCLPAGGREGSRVVPLRGGRPIEVVAKDVPLSHAPYAPRKFSGSGQSIYNCMQEFFLAEELSGISCSACSTAATQLAVEKKLALAARSRGRKEEEHYSAAGDAELERQIMSEILERCRTLRVVGERDALIADFDQGFIAHPLKGNQREAILLRKPHGARAKPESPASVASVAPDAAAARVEETQEMLFLSLRQPRVSGAVKRTSLSRLPPLLCLYLCRRTYDGMKGRMKKLVQHVSFPVLLSMDEFHAADGAHRSPLGLAGALAVQGLSVGAGAGASITALLNSARNGHKKDVGGNYQLRAVVEHKGTADSGHYVSYCLVNELPLRRWEYFSDEQHHAVPEETVLNAQATMLFYEKVGSR